MYKKYGLILNFGLFFITCYNSKPRDFLVWKKFRFGIIFQKWHSMPNFWSHLFFFYMLSALLQTKSPSTEYDSNHWVHICYIKCKTFFKNLKSSLLYNSFIHSFVLFSLFPFYIFCYFHISKHSFKVFWPKKVVGKMYWIRKNVGIHIFTDTQIFNCVWIVFDST